MFTSAARSAVAAESSAALPPEVGIGVTAGGATGMTTDTGSGAGAGVGVGFLAGGGVAIFVEVVAGAVTFGSRLGIVIAGRVTLGSTERVGEVVAACSLVAE